MSQSNSLNRWNAYFWDNNPKNCMKNKLNIHTRSKLDKVEKYEIIKAIERLNARKTKFLGIDYWKYIHKELFGHLYEWAGQIRDVDMERWDVPYLSYEVISGQLKKLDLFLKEKSYMKDDKNIEHYVKLYSELQRCHPFREGNTRSSKIYMNALAYQNGFSFNWSRLTAEGNVKMKKELHINKDNTILRTILNNIKIDENFTDINNFGINNAENMNEFITNTKKKFKILFRLKIQR